MFVAVLGWLTICLTLFVALGAIWWLDTAARRPWRLRPRVRVPREVKGLEWDQIEPLQDNPLPWT